MTGWIRKAGVTLALATAFAGTTAKSQTDKSQSAEEFFRGKKMDMLIGYSAGGTYDLYARLVARQLSNYLPGAPVIVPRNMPGGGSRTAVTWLYTAAPRDGTVLATADQSLSVEQAMGDKQLKIDTRELIYIGNPAADNNTTAILATSPVKNIEDAKRIEIPLGATGGSTSSQYPKAMNALLGTKFKIITGYPGGNDINLAMERGEVAGRGSNSWGAWKSTRPQWIAENKLTILVQIGLFKAPDLPHVPLLMDLAKNEEDRAVLKLLSASTTIGRPIFTTPGVPDDRVKLLRAWFERMVKDPVFLDQAKKENLDIQSVSGEELQRIVTEIVATPPKIAARLQEIIGGIEHNNNTGR